jgi:hypothetical protein
MELLGAYISNLPEWHSQELLNLLEAGVASGDYGGGALVNQKVAADLQEEAGDFTTLPAILAGSRALAQSINYPMSLLAARYAAMVTEQQDFVTRMGQYLAVLEADAEMVEQLLNAVELENWVQQQPQVTDANTFCADFGATHGSIDTTVPLTDPATNVAYVDSSGNPLRLNDVSAVIDGSLKVGLGAPLASSRSAVPSNLDWTHSYDPDDVEVLSGSDWASLTLMAPGPLLSLGAPVARVILPDSQASAQVLQVGMSKAATSNLPVFVNITFLPRPRSDTFVVDPANYATQSFSLGPNRCTADGLIVYDATQSYEEGQDYQLDITSAHWNLIPMSSLAGKTVNVLVTEYFPAYQCSINNEDWSPALFFDANNLYPNPQQSFVPVAIEQDPQGDWFPVTDELGTPVGIYMRPAIFLAMEYLLRVETPGNENTGVGMNAVLEVELEQPGYYTSIQVEPFTALPAYLTQISVEGIEIGQIATVFTGNILIDRAMGIRITQQDGTPVYVRMIYLSLVQNNYSLTEEVINPADQFRRDALAQIQAVIPFTTRQIEASVPQHVIGAQYELGLRNISAKNEVFNGTGVMVSGPFAKDGCPEMVRVDVDCSGPVNCYLYCKLYDGSGDEPQPTMVGPAPSGSAISFPDFVVTLGSPTIVKVEFFLKWVMSDTSAVLRRYLLQVS